MARQRFPHASRLQLNKFAIDAAINRGLTLHQSGKFAEAQHCYEQVLALQPEHFDALQLLGALSVQIKQYDQAVICLTKALALNPHHAGCYSNRGSAFKALMLLEDALSDYDLAILVKPDYAEAYFNRGNVLQDLQQYDAAMQSYEQAIHIKSNYAEAYYNRGNVLQSLNQFEQSILNYDLAIGFNPNYALAYLNRGNAYKALERLEEALSSYDKAISIHPNNEVSYSNRGNVLKDLGRFTEALSSYDAAIRLKPDYPEAYSNRGLTLQALKRLDEALSDYAKAIRINLHCPEANFNLSLCNLLMGNFNDGWTGYEWRRKNLHASKLAEISHLPEPLWLGDGQINGKTILLHAEQGLGDTIQFFRYVSLVAQLGATIILEVQRPLLKLFSPLKGVSQIVAKGDHLPSYDLQCPLLSLPLAFKTELHSIPPAIQCISNSTEKIAFWQGLLGEKTRPRVGIAWSGNPSHNNDRNRSITLAQLLPYLPDRFEYVCLQKEIRPIDSTPLSSRPDIKFFGDQFIDFCDTAALCELMDLVISVDTSVAHLAGTLNKPTWVLLPYSPDWRWLLNRDDSPWYPSVTLFRQDTIGHWDQALETVKNALVLL